MTRLLPFIVAALILGAAGTSKSASTTDGPYRIHVITIGQGDELFTRFGHIALVVENVGRDERLVYNFGTFDFEDPSLRIRYARGFLNYWLSVAPFESFYYFYAQTNREMWMQTLNLSDTAAREMAHNLKINARPENKYYAYRHFLDNCSTRIRDAIDEATEGALSKKYKVQKVNRDFRYWTAQCLNGLPLYKSVILYSLGPAIDQPLTRWDEEFLPQVLFEDLDRATVGPSNVPLVARKQLLLKRQGPGVGKTIPTIDIVVIGTVAALLLLGFAVPLVAGDRSWSRRALGLGLVFWGLLSGLGGLMLLLYWTATTHYDTHYNENLLINPFVHLWLIGPGVALLIRAKVRPHTQMVLKYLFPVSLGIVLLDVLLKIGPFIQDNWGAIALAAVVNLAAVFALKRTGVLAAAQ